MIISLLIGIAVISVIVIAHELGHFIIAKATGVKVEEFGLGFPPRLLSFQLGETRYSLNAIPFGGFNKLSGEEDPQVAGGLAGKNRGIRLLVLSGGSLMNFLLALFLLSTIFIIPHEVLTGQVVVEGVSPGSPAVSAGISPGDIILSVNRRPVANTADLHRYVQLNLGKEVNIVVQHSDSSQEDVSLVPRWKPPPEQGAIGVSITLANPIIVRQQYPFWKAVPLGLKEFVETFILYKNGIISTIIGTASAQLVGPVGIVQLSGEIAVKAGIYPLLEFAAFISLLLGIFNLFPLPAIDGGRVAFVLLEWLRRGKRIAAKTEGRVHLIGFLLLMLFLLAVTFQDIMRIISGGSLIP